MNPRQEKTLPDSPTSAWARRRSWCGSRTAISGSMWSRCDDGKVNAVSWRGWFDEICYRKIEETNNTDQLLSHISLQVVFHSASTDVLSKPASERTKRWVFHHFPRDSHPQPNRSFCQEDFFHIFSLIFPILHFIPLLS